MPPHNPALRGILLMFIARGVGAGLYLVGRQRLTVKK